MKLLHLLYIAKKQKLMEQELMKWQKLPQNIPRNLGSQEHMFRFS